MFHVLLVKDEHTLAKKLARSTRRAGLKVDTSIAGTKASSICNDGDFDSSCIDIYPPGCNGENLEERLRLLQPARPGVVMSGEGRVTNKAPVHKLGAKAYLTKPFQIFALHGQLKELSEVARQSPLYSQQLNIRAPPGPRRD